MKNNCITKFLGIVVLSLLLTNYAYSSSYKNLEIEGIKIGQNIYQVVGEKTVLGCLNRLNESEFKPYGGNTKFILCNFSVNEILDTSKVLNNYDWIRVHYKKIDNKIHHISGGIFFYSMRQCVNDLNKYKIKYDEFFKDALKRIETKIYSKKNQPGTNVKQVYYKYSDGFARLICYDRSRVTNYEGNEYSRIKLNIQSGTNEFMDFVKQNPESLKQSSENLKIENKNSEKSKTLGTSGLTLSVADSLKAQIFTCWSVPIGLPFSGDSIIRVKLNLKSDGIIEKLEILDQDIINAPGKEHLRTLADSVKGAIKLCNPLKVPESGHERWKELILKFDARDMLGG